jgi:hypothetical protein
MEPEGSLPHSQEPATASLTLCSVGADWILLAHNRINGRAFLNLVMNLVSIKGGMLLE